MFGTLKQVSTNVAKIAYNGPICSDEMWLIMAMFALVLPLQVFINCINSIMCGHIVIKMASEAKSRQK